MRQERSSSPICLNIITNELAHAIQSAGIGVEVGKRENRNTTVRRLYSAAGQELTRQGEAMRSIREMERYKMKINVEKSEIVEYGKGAEACINGEALKAARHYKYLGYIEGE